jgi:hypothetical protein
MREVFRSLWAGPTGSRRILSRAVTTLAAVAAALLVLPAGVAHADRGWHEIRSQWSWKCMDMIRQDGTGAGVHVQQWDCTNTPEQMFIALDVGNDYFQLQNLRSGKCLRPDNSTTENGALIEQTYCHTEDLGQHWKQVDPGGNSQGARWLINRNSNKCVEDSAWSTQSGTLLTQSDCVMGWKDYWRGLEDAR